MDETVTAMEHGIWSNQKLCSEAMFTNTQFQNKVSFIPFKRRVVFLHQN